MYLFHLCVTLHSLFSKGFPIKTSSRKQPHLYAVWVTLYLSVSQFVYQLIECQLAARHVIPIHLESLGWINCCSFDFPPCWTIRKSNASLQIKFQEKRHTVCQAMRFLPLYKRRMECSHRAKYNICKTNIYKQSLDEQCQLNSCIGYSATIRFSRFGAFAISRGWSKNKVKISLELSDNSTLFCLSITKLYVKKRNSDQQT
jgi:hypothetical protein